MKVSLVKYRREATVEIPLSKAKITRRSDVKLNWAGNGKRRSKLPLAKWKITRRSDVRLYGTVNGSHPSYFPLGRPNHSQSTRSDSQAVQRGQDTTFSLEIFIVARQKDEAVPVPQTYLNLGLTLTLTLRLHCKGRTTENKKSVNGDSLLHSASKFCLSAGKITADPPV